MKRIGVITWHYYENFGSALQIYALQVILEKLRTKVEIINYRNPKFGKYSKVKVILRLVMHYFTKYLGSANKKRYAYTFLRFQNRFLNQGSVIQTSEKLKKRASKYHSVLCGSDQIWAPNVFNPIYMLNFVNGQVTRKISYAASIGLDYLPADLVPVYTELLSDFNSISVREELGKELLYDRCGISSTVVLDPTLLLSSKEYQHLQRKVNTPGNFIFCYFLNADHEYQKTVQDFAREKNCEIIGWSAKENDSDWMTLMQWIGPCEFLWLIEHAECIFTDSYHGTIFSLLYHKVFWTFERFRCDDPICQNSRLYQIEKHFGISNRIVQVDSPRFDCLPMDYESFDRKLTELREKSINYLKKALE